MTPAEGRRVNGHNYLELVSSIISAFNVMAKPWYFPTILNSTPENLPWPLKYNCMSEYTTVMLLFPQTAIGH